MSILRIVIGPIVLVAFSFSVSAEEGSWQRQLRAAEKVSHQGHKNDSLLIRAQDSALFLGNQALQLARTEESASDSSIGYILNHLGDYHFRAGRVEKAVDVWTDALANYRRVFGNDERRLDATLFRLSFCASHPAFRSKLNTDVTEAVKLRDDLLNTDDPTNSVRLRDLAELYLKYEEVEAGEETYRKVISLWEQNQTTSPEYAIIGLILLAEDISKSFANINTDIHHQDSAIKLGSYALQIAQSAFGDFDPIVAYVLQRLGDYHARNGEYLLSESMWMRAGDINFAKLPPEHIEYQGSVFRIGCSHLRFGRCAEAQPLLKDALRLRIKTQGAGHPEVAAMNIVLAQLYHRTGDFIKAEKHFETALRIREEAIERVESDIGQTYRYLGQMYRDQGRYSRAEECFSKAYEIRRVALGESHSLTAATLRDLANLYGSWGRDEESEILLEKVLEAATDFLGESHPTVAATLCDLASLYSRKGHHDQATEYLLRALVIVEQTVGTAHALYIETIRGLAQVYGRNGKLEEAEKLYRQALAINDSFQPPVNHDLVACLDDLATVLCRQSEYVEAQRLYERGMAIAENAPARIHPALAACFENYARLCLATGQPAKALALTEKALTIRQANFLDGAPVMAERDVLRYARLLHESRDLYLTAYFLAPENEERTARAINTILATKGLVTDEIIRRTRMTCGSVDESLKAYVDSLKFAQSRLSRMYVEGPGESSENYYRQVLDSVQRERHRLESIVAGRSRFKPVGDLKESVNLVGVKAAMPDKSALVEYLKFDFRKDVFDPRNPYYLAVIITPGGATEITLLDRAGGIDSLICDYRQHLLEVVRSKELPSAEATDDHDRLSSSLYAAIWRPLAPSVPDDALLLIAPDGDLNLISFAGLVTGDGDYLVQRHATHFISSGRDLIRLRDQSAPGDGLFILGDPDFDSVISGDSASSELLAQIDNTGNNLHRLRDLRATCDPIWKTKVQRLPGTSAEIEIVSQNWIDAGRGAVWKYTRADATEENFKLNAPGKQVVHLATHGYFAGSCQADDNEQTSFSSSEFIEGNPLLLSGLFLSGVNRPDRKSVGATHEDGVLTAEEVCSLDFTHTQCVVLSACESGLGEVRAGEGVYGLRRAFQLAGARTIVSSLWPVGDIATGSMMSSLYRKSGKSIAVAIREAMLDRLKDLHDRHQPAHPALWAAFISFGDWESIAN